MTALVLVVVVGVPAVMVALAGIWQLAWWVADRRGPA